MTCDEPELVPLSISARSAVGADPILTFTQPIPENATIYVGVAYAPGVTSRPHLIFTTTDGTILVPQLGGIIRRYRIDRKITSIQYTVTGATGALLTVWWCPPSAT